MLGELNGSHTGARYYSASSTPATAAWAHFMTTDTQATA